MNGKITVAKRNLKKGEYLDGIGGFTVYGRILVKEEAEEMSALPIGLVDENVIMTRDIKKGQIVTFKDVEQTNQSLIWSLRDIQDKIKF